MSSIRKARRRSRAQRTQDRNDLVVRICQSMHSQFSTLSVKAKEFVDLNHLPMFCYGSRDDYNSSLTRIVTVGLNPAPSSNEKNPLCVGDEASDLALRVSDGDIDVKLGKEVLDHSQQYFQIGKAHIYFANLLVVLGELQATYNKTLLNENAALHIDLFKWSTSVPWRSLPKVVANEMISRNFIINDLVILKPQIVILSLDIAKVIRIIPGIQLELLASYNKKNDVDHIYYGFKRIPKVGNVLFVQTTPSPNPFGKLTHDQKREVGAKIRRLIGQ